jgi:basic amino acid/polyamine antiporter, APA family
MTVSTENKEPINKFKLKRKISVVDAVAIVIGMVIGPGIFKTPAIVAANASTEMITLSLWVIGGAVSLIGAFCYAELSSTYPHTGGEYHFLTRSFGNKLSFLFAWARMTVIQTGSIAMLAFLIGDYASEAFRLGTYSSSIYAVITIFILTAVNLKGINPSSKMQRSLMSGILLGILSVIVIGLAAGSSNAVQAAPVTNFAIGHAMIFVLLTYGGWNEAAYLSAEVGRKKNIVKVLFYSIALITFIYLLTNFALIKGLGFSNVASSDAVAADLIALSLGENWVKMISIIIAVAAFSTVNAVMITGARTNFALGQDFKNFHFLSKWKAEEGVPVNAFLFQTGLALLLVFLGTATRSGFVTMVEYTAPVFWFFFLLVGISIFILRIKDPSANRPFKVPFYPVTPILFCAAAGYMLHASLAYTGVGALIGIAVLLLGLPFLLINKLKIKKHGG